MRTFNDEINKIIENYFSKIENEDERIEKVIKTYKFAIDKISIAIKEDLDKNIWKLRKENKLFKKENLNRIKRVWRKVFDILDKILKITQESMESYSKEFNEKATEEHNLTYHAIRTIHARVVLCFKECLLLIKNGYAEGVTRIWRTMYELTVIALFLKKHSDNKLLAKKYIDHIIVDEYKEEKIFRNQDNIAYNYTDEAFKRLEEEYNAIISQYGKSFENDYGWANDFFKATTFHNIEADTKEKNQKPYYKLSCYTIHGNYKSNVNKIGLIDDTVILYGPSDYGLSEPCQNIAITLNKMNAIFFTIYFSIDYIASIEAINLYLDELLPLANEIQNELKNNYYI